MKTSPYFCLAVLVSAAFAPASAVARESGGWHGGGGWNHMASSSRAPGPAVHFAPNRHFAGGRASMAVPFGTVRTPRFAARGEWHGDRGWRDRGNGDWRRHGRSYIGWTSGWPFAYPGYGYYDYAPDYSSDEYVAAPSPAVAGDSLVVDVERALARAGYYHGPIDGVLGAGMRDAIAAYQRDYRLPVTGRIGNALLDSLGLE
jgi:hypothetical protein